MTMTTSAASAVRVTMMDFLRTGLFGPLTLGASRESVQKTLGDPGSLAGSVQRSRLPAVLKYGYFEFHFETRTDRLHRIRLERFDRVDAGSSIVMDPWWMAAEATLDQARGELGNVGISLEAIPWPYTDNTVRYRVGAGITLIFQQQPPQKFVGLTFSA